MPYENPYQDTRAKTETFFRDFFLWDAFTRGSADYAYEVQGVSNAVGGWNQGFITDVADREAFMNIYKETVIREQMLYNSLVNQSHVEQRTSDAEDKFYLQSLDVERKRVAILTDKINKLQADAGVERQEDIRKMRAEREETIARLTKSKEEADKARAEKYYLRRDNEAPPSINMPPQSPLIPQWFPIIPDVFAPDAQQALSMKILLGLAFLGVLVF